MDQPAQYENPGAEFVFLFFASGVVFAVGAAIAALIFYIGHRRRSVLLQMLAVLPLIGGAVIFAPAALFASVWIYYWVTHPTN